MPLPVSGKKKTAIQFVLLNGRLIILVNALFLFASLIKELHHLLKILL